MKKIILPLALLIPLSTFAFGGSQKKANLSTDEGKLSYAIGQQVGRQLKSSGFKFDQATLFASISEALEGKESKMTIPEMQAALSKAGEAEMAKMEAEGKANLEKGAKFMAENKSKPGVKTTASGLQYQTLQPGKGKSPKATDTVRVHYTGTLIDGTKFDSSVDRGQPAEFPLNGVIRGWTEGLQLMKVGEKARFVIPSELAYGPQGRPSIPPSSTLVFEVELLEIKK